jgi:hypothetical protein
MKTDPGHEYVAAHKTRVKFREMSWPRAGKYASDLEWLLRYGDPTKSDLLAAAGIISAYQQMVFDPESKRRIVIAGLRRAEIEDPQVENDEPLVLTCADCDRQFTGSLVCLCQSALHE